MNKLKMHSPNLTDANIARIREMFPGCVTEAKGEDGSVKLAVDFDQLRQELSDVIVEGPQERYHLNWPGKREALLTANAPIAKTLRPCREESVDFDTTKNLFIEGDNLDALKLLQETYLGKVKMIYIDPPYNTGNDFIYEDDFAEDTGEYLRRSNQVDEEGNRLTTNSVANGRFHSDWLSMIYQRIKLARHLLADDGVIFLSIDDGEVANLRGVCDEIFGSGNFVADLIWQKKFSRANDATYFSTMHDHILCYAKNHVLTSADGWKIGLLPRGNEIPSGYGNLDSDPRGLWTSVALQAKSGSQGMLYEIVTPSGRKCYPPNGRYWSVSQEKYAALLQDNRIWFGKDGSGTPRQKTFLSEVQQGLRPNTILLHGEAGHNQEAKQETKDLFAGIGVFDGPKPVRLLKFLCTIANLAPDSIVLDFFAGSATTAHAVMLQNAADNYRHRFIMVQLPEPCAEDSEAFKMGYKTIAEVSKERIRRAGKKIAADLANSNIDTGFRVLKIDTSNMADVYYAPDALDKFNLDLFVDNIKPDRTAEDLLFQVMLDWGVDLALPIEKKAIQGKDVFFVDDDALAACFDAHGGIDEAFVKELAKHKPLRAVFRDAGFKDSAVKINVEQIFKLLSPGTEVKSI